MNSISIDLNRLNEKTHSKAPQSPATLNRLFGSPPPIQIESFSGWLFRVAGHHRIRLDTLSRLLCIKYPSNTYDFTRRLTPESADRIAAVLRLDPNNVAQTTQLWAPHLSKSEYKALTFDLRTLTPIYKICIQCLKYDDIPFVRRSWRFSHSLVCEHHKTPLISTCRVCRAPFDFTHNNPRWRTDDQRSVVARYCPLCSSNILYNPKKKIVLDEANWKFLLNFQKKLDPFIRSGMFRHPEFGTVSAYIYLQTFYSTNKIKIGNQTQECLAEIDYRRCFGPHAESIVTSLFGQKHFDLMNATSRDIYEANRSNS